MARALLAIGREDLRGQMAATLAELGGEVEVLGVAETSHDLLLGLESNSDVDLVFIEDGIGPLPFLALTREVVSRAPDIGVILVVSDSPDSNFYQAAMDSGARGVIEQPPTVGELSARLPMIQEWQRQVRGLHSSLGLGSAEQAGRMIAFTGVKGGVGTTTLAVHCALLAAASGPERRVCLLDLDLQHGGVGQVLEVSAKRTIHDLITISDSLSGRNLDEATFVHRSGLRVLSAPKQGEQAEDIESSVAREVLAAAKGHYDLVIVDAGSVVTEASAVGMEFADEVYLVTTPDIGALRAAQDKADLLNRLQIVKEDGLHLVFNKVSSKNEVQPEFGARMGIAEVTGAHIPEDWRRLEPAANALDPGEVEDGPFRRAMLALGRELRLGSSAPGGDDLSEENPKSKGKSKRKNSKRRNSRGQVTIETLVGLGLAMVILLVLIQAAMMAMGLVVSRRAADEAARVGSRGGSTSQAQEAARHRSPDFYQVNVERLNSNQYRATVRSPSIMPFINRTVSSTGSAAQE